MNAPSLINAPSTFYGKKVAKCQTKWLQHIETLVYLPPICVKNFIFGTSELQRPWGVY